VIFVGTYTGRGSEGIYAGEMDAEPGGMAVTQAAEGIQNH